MVLAIGAQFAICAIPLLVLRMFNSDGSVRNGLAPKLCITTPEGRTSIELPDNLELLKVIGSATGSGLAPKTEEVFRG